MAFVVLILLLEMRQGPWAGRLPVGDVAQVRTDRSLNLFGLPPVGLEVVAADHDVLPCSSACHGSSDVDFRTPKDAPEGPEASSASWIVNGGEIPGAGVAGGERASGGCVGPVDMVPPDRLGSPCEPTAGKPRYLVRDRSWQCLYNNPHT